MMDNAMAKIKRQNGKQMSTKYHTDGPHQRNKVLFVSSIWGFVKKNGGCTFE
jgi:hypothetical protein